MGQGTDALVNPIQKGGFLVQKKIIAVEGVCCSGKSTLVRELGKTGGFNVVGEYGEYTESFPTTAQDLQGLMENTNFFIELEERRYHNAMSKASIVRQVLDRSFITCCAFDYAAFAGTDLAGYLPLVENAWRQVDRKLVPNTVVVLGVSDETFRKRLRSSGRSLTPLLRDKEFNRRFYQYLSEVENRWGTRLVWVDTDELTAPKVALRVLRML